MTNICNSGQHYYKTLFKHFRGYRQLVLIMGEGYKVSWNYHMEEILETAFSKVNSKAL